jgi:bacterioferritin
VVLRYHSAIPARQDPWSACTTRRIPSPTITEALMQGDKNVIKLLNAQLTNELSAINQYFLHARMYKHWGLDKIAKKEYEESIGEMKHADKLIDRILMLGGLPNLQALHKLMIGENTLEMLKSDLALETAAQVTVKDGIATSEKAGDYVSRDLLKLILEDTEEHIDWLETQLDLIEKIGLPNYLQAQIIDGSGS